MRLFVTAVAVLLPLVSSPPRELSTSTLTVTLEKLVSEVGGEGRGGEVLDGRGGVCEGMYKCKVTPCNIPANTLYSSLW